MSPIAGNPITKMLLALDDLLLDAVERAYLWLFDRTGVPKGAIEALIGAAATLSSYWAGTFKLPLTLGILFGCGLFGLISMGMQSFGTSEAARISMAAAIDDLRQARWRRLFYPLNVLAFVALAVLLWAKGSQDWGWALVMPLVAYVALARTRERRPPRRRKSSEALSASATEAGRA